MANDEKMVQVGDTAFYIWPDTHSWNVGKKVPQKPGKKDKRDYRMDFVTYHGTLRQAVVEVFERKLKVNVADAENLAQMRDSYMRTVEWIRGLFPDI